MSYAELKYHSNDYTFMQIMADVLNVTKIQLKMWKDQKLAKVKPVEESKSEFVYNINPSQKKDNQEAFPNLL